MTKSEVIFHCCVFWTGLFKTLT